MKRINIALAARRALLGAAAALALALAPAPALALGVAPTSAQELPASIDASVPDDATLVSTELRAARGRRARVRERRAAR